MGRKVDGGKMGDYAAPAGVQPTVRQTNNALMHEVLRRIEMVSLSDVSVAVLGERGTGKEWVAHLIHQMSPRAAEPFHVFDCAAESEESIEKDLLGAELISWSGVDIREGALERASGGTLVLDEMAELQPAMLTRIVRTVEYQTFRRVGGNQDLQLKARIIGTITQRRATDGKATYLHEEMIHRMSAISIELPPLRKRREDIPLLVHAFLRDLQTKYHVPVSGISDEALHLCQTYSWPGNVRQLKNAIEYASIMSGRDLILRKNLPPYLTSKKEKKAS